MQYNNFINIQISVPDDKKQESWFTRSTLKQLAKDVKDVSYVYFIHKLYL